MPRGRPNKDGDTRVAQNGYHYTRQDGKWRLTHHVIAEKKLGRPLTSEDGVFFKDGDRTNLSEDNIATRARKPPSDMKRLAILRAKIEDLTAEADELEAAISAKQKHDDPASLT